MAEGIRIEELRLHHVRVPLRRPFRISVGELREKDAVLVEARADGLTGWGEAAVDATPFYTWETVGTVRDVARSVLGPMFLERAWSSAAELATAFGAVRGHHFAKAAFELALWDILGQREQNSLAALLGGVREWVEWGPSIGIQREPAALVDAVAGWLDRGARRIKLKVMPDLDNRFIEAVRERFPAIALMVDANSAYRPADADRLAAWDAYDLLMIEQPFDAADLFYHAELARRMQTPICLDESIDTMHSADCAVQMQAADIVNVKVGRVGGLVHTRQIHDRLQRGGVPVWIGSRLDVGVAAAMRLAAASLPNAVYPTDAGMSGRYVADDVLAAPYETREGRYLRVPTRPGNGAVVDREKLAHYTVGTHTLRSE